MTLDWGGENTQNEAFNFYPIFIPLIEGKVSGVSGQDMLLCPPFLTPCMKLQFLFRFDRPFFWPAAGLTPETKFAEQKRFKKLSLCA